MITMLPVKDRELLQSLNEKENTNANLGYALYDENEITGYVLYNLFSEYGEFVAINANSLSEKDGLIRAALGSLYEVGINKAIFKYSFPIEIVRKLNMLQQEEYTIPSIYDILFQCCSCKKANNG
ncbi:hypothetical protein RBG61_09595 [Paludicola sp. MB14-C6]|uniref:hypothetical protein n=1 Tax=Paludihabitans sp. MB14-C6 TaxID=3070656 RepID=UPI0027DADD24|nr:hypothetical protein [Paludicola sp. MB14-C6]WMJ22241.1 hypothetical protein RBG61_09595 [Paludicola sp. MB14-C6]